MNKKEEERCWICKRTEAEIREIGFEDVSIKEWIKKTDGTNWDIPICEVCSDAIMTQVLDCGFITIDELNERLSRLEITIIEEPHE